MIIDINVNTEHCDVTYGLWRRANPFEGLGMFDGGFKHSSSCSSDLGAMYVLRSHSGIDHSM